MIGLVTFVRDVGRKFVFCWTEDRIGPDLPFTHWMLHFKASMRWWCRRKFRRFGEDADFRPGAYAFNTRRVEIGDRVIVHPGIVLGGDPGADLIIEDDVLIGMNAHLYADNHRFDDVTKPINQQGYESKTVRICSGSWIGANAVVLAGVTVGQNAVVAAGAVVTDDVEPFTVVGGVPARVLKRLA